MAKYLDWGGLQTFWINIKNYISNYAQWTSEGNGGADAIKLGSTTKTPIQWISAGTGLNTTSDNTTTDGGTIGMGDNQARSGTLYLTKSGVTEGSYGPSAAENTPTAGQTFSVPYLTVDKYGRVTAATTNTVQIPDAPSSFNISVTDDILDGTGGANSVRYAPYSSKAAGKLYTGTTNPSSTNRLNYDGYLWASKLYSGGDEVLTSHQTIVQDGITGATINRFGTCTIAAATAAKTVSITSGTVPTLNADASGLQVTVKFSNANTANNPTLNVDNKGAKKIYHRGSQITTGTNKALLAGVCTFVYDNSLDSDNGGWHLIGNYYDTTTDTKVTQLAAITTSGSYPIMLGYSTATTEVTNTLNKASSFTYNPATKNLTISNGSINASTFNGVDISNSSGGITVGDGTTGIFINNGDSYTLGAACVKGVDTSIGSSTSHNLPTTEAVRSFVNNSMSSVTGALVYKGTITAESDLLSTVQSYKSLSKGWYYIVNMPTTTPETTSITVGGVECEAGDMIIVKTAGAYETSSALGDAIDVIQSNIAVITDTEINALPDTVIVQSS